MSPIDFKTDNHRASEKSSDELTDVGTGHDDHVADAGILSERAKAKKDNGVQNTSDNTGNQNGNTQINRKLFRNEW